jgi:hypothetical protein
MRRSIRLLHPTGELPRCADSTGDQDVEQISRADCGEPGIDSRGSVLVSQLDDVGGAIIELAVVGCCPFFRRQIALLGYPPRVVPHDYNRRAIPGSILPEFFPYMCQILIAKRKVIKVSWVDVAKLVVRRL